MDEPRSISLFRRYRAGDEAALEDLLNRYLPRVFRIVRASLSGELKSKLEADDVVQVVMLRAVESLDSFEFREDAALVKWMARIARNEIIHQARKLQAVKRDPRREMSLDLSVTSRAPPTRAYSGVPIALDLSSALTQQQHALQSDVDIFEIEAAGPLLVLNNWGGSTSRTRCGCTS